MPPILCFVGYSNTGKTSLLEKLIPVLKRRNYKIGAIKNDVHGFEIDHQGTDTDRLKRAGAIQVAISGPGKFAFISEQEKEIELRELAEKYFTNMDLLFTEGFKHSDYPKIEVYFQGAKTQPLGEEISNIRAVVSDKKLDKNVPHFNFKQIEALADFIEEEFIKSRPDSQQRVQLYVNGKYIKLKPFIDEMMLESITGMLKALKDCEAPKEVRIKFNT